MDGERDILDQSGGRRRSKILARLLFYFIFWPVASVIFRSVAVDDGLLCVESRGIHLSLPPAAAERAGCLLPYILCLRVWTRGVPLGVIFIYTAPFERDGHVAYRLIFRAAHTTCTRAELLIIFCFFIFASTVNQIGTHTQKQVYFPSVRVPEIFFSLRLGQLP